MDSTGGDQLYRTDGAAAGIEMVLPAIMTNTNLTAGFYFMVLQNAEKNIYKKFLPRCQ